MRVFNSFQIVAAFVAWPYLIQWLSKADFPASTAAFVSSIIFYLVAFIAMIVCVAETLGKR